MYDPKLGDWRSVQPLVFPHVTTLDQYQKHVDARLLRVERYLEVEARTHAVPSPETLRMAHEIAFGNLYRSAGEFRGRDDTGKVPEAAFYMRIEYELERLNDHVRSLLSSRASKEERAHGAALYHVQFESICPFQVGNGRLGRRIAQAQRRSLLGKEPEPQVDRDTYLLALNDAKATKNLAGLSYALTGVVLPKSLRVTDYDMALWPAPVEKRTAKGSLIRVEARDLDTAEDILDARITKRLAQAADRDPHAPAPPMILDTSSRPIKLDIDIEKLHELGRDERREEWLLEMEASREYETDH